MVVFLRVLAGSLATVAAAVVIVPILVLVDLTSGGTGLGLCPAGLMACSNGYFTGPELFGLLTSALFVVGGALAVTLRILRSVERRGDRLSAPR